MYTYIKWYIYIYNSYIHWISQYPISSGTWGTKAASMASDDIGFKWLRGTSRSRRCAWSSRNLPASPCHLKNVLRINGYKMIKMKDHSTASAFTWIGIPMTCSALPSKCWSFMPLPWIIWISSKFFKKHVLQKRFDAFPPSFALPRCHLQWGCYSPWCHDGSLLAPWCGDTLALPRKEWDIHAPQWHGETNSSREIPRTYILHTGCYCNLENQPLQILQVILQVRNKKNIVYMHPRSFFSTSLTCNTETKTVDSLPSWKRLKETTQ